MRKPKISKLQKRELKDSLSYLRFYSYGDYLKSQVWQKIRKEVLESNSWQCKYCDRKASQVHHESYDLDTMSGRNLRYLTPVCWSCHKTGHKKGEAVKPVGANSCPRCKKRSLTKEEKNLNIMGAKSDKVVCKFCRGSARLKYKKDHEVVVAPKYKDLPNYYKWHFNKKI